MQQLPAPGEIFLDHVAHFVPDMAAAGDALVRAGFAPTSFVLQTNAGPDGVPVPAGTGNRCAMLRAGYMEVLAATSDTELSRQFRRQLDRHVGVHLLAFATADADREHRRLEAEGFTPTPLVRLQRPVETPAGPAVARFTVARVPPAVMPEGRMQILTHHTETEVWQPRWLDQPNAAVALDGAVVVVADPAEAAARFGRFTGRPARLAVPGHHVLALDRGGLHLVSPARLDALIPGAVPPALPWIAGYSLISGDIEASRRWFAGRMPEATRPLPQGLLVEMPPALGGYVLFADRPDAWPLA
jgi:hypothetical protein